MPLPFFDGQNLFHHAKAAFGHTHPNYDPQKLHAAICKERGWIPSAVHFYTGVPNAKTSKNRQWCEYWGKRLRVMAAKGIVVTKRKLQYPEGEENPGREKCIDVCIALDMVRLAFLEQYEAAVLFSQDRDISEAFYAVKEISRKQNRKVTLVCAYPVGPLATAKWAVRGHDEVFKMDETFYNKCLDPRDYRE